MEKAQVIKLLGLGFKKNKFKDVPVSIALCTDKVAAGFSKPITGDAKKEMINNYLKRLQLELANAQKNSKEAKAILNQTISVEFGKQSLLLLLSQPGTEGIRFSFAVGREGQDTLVAEGMGGTEGHPEPVKPARVQDSKGELKECEPMIFEVVPPGTFGAWLKNKGGSEVVFL